MKTKTSRPQPAAAEAYGSTIGETLKSLSDLSLPLPALSALQSDYVKEATELWNRVVTPTQA